MSWGELQKANGRVACRCRSCGREIVVEPKKILSISGEASLSEALALLTCRVCGTRTIEAK
jgi:hypothetical protein